MKRISVRAIAVAALAVTCAFALAACGGQSSSSQSSSSDAQSDQKIVVGSAADNYGEGEGQGFTDSAAYNQFIKSTLESLGWETELKGIAYADIEKSINDGTIDCFWDNYTIQGREDMYAWSEAYMQAKPVLVWKSADGTFKTEAGLADVDSISPLPTGKTIGVKAGSVTYADLPDDQKAIVDSIGTLKEYAGLAQCKEALDKGEVDMVLTEMALATPLFADHSYYRVAFAATGSNCYGVAFKKGNDDKAQAFSATMKEVYASCTLKGNALASAQDMGFDSAAAEELWNDFDKDWLLK